MRRELMKSLKEKKVSVAFLLTAAVFVIQLVDLFFIKSDEDIFGDTFVARILGIVLIYVVSSMLEFHVKRRCFNGFGRIFELAYGVAFSLAPIVLVYAAELIYFKIKGFYHDVSLTLIPPNITKRGLYASLAIYAVALLVNVFFKELYRGFMLNQLFRRFGSNRSIYIQAALCVVLLIPYIIAAFADGGFDGKPTLDIVITVAASIAGVFISSLRWGFCYKVNGSLWMSLADHFVNTFIMTCVYFSPDRLPDKWLLVKSLVIQVISCVIFIPFYYRRERVNAEYKKEMKTRHDVLSAMNESENGIDEKTVSNNYLMMMNETEQNKRFGSIKQNEVLDFDREPGAYAKKYSPAYNEKTERNRHESNRDGKRSGGRKRKMRSTEAVPENAESISKLVDEYFKKQFDKNTFE